MHDTVAPAIRLPPGYLSAHSSHLSRWLQVFSSSTSLSQRYESPLGLSLGFGQHGSSLWVFVSPSGTLQRRRTKDALVEGTTHAYGIQIRMDFGTSVGSFTLSLLSKHDSNHCPCGTHWLIRLILFQQYPNDVQILSS
ncbi:hypothetical protein K449DRAFT_431022 [Hypoxylon sp. EC38]|nr:hypothetical protein K449DRAFT_431022 [Hypoxylon sp. EC38]